MHDIQLARLLHDNVIYCCIVTIEQVHSFSRNRNDQMNANAYLASKANLDIPGIYIEALFDAILIMPTKLKHYRAILY